MWANAAPKRKKAVSVRLPAEPEGTTYYLRELSSAAGFAADETIYEVTLTAGETRDAGLRGFQRQGASLSWI